MRGCARALSRCATKRAWQLTRSALVLRTVAQPMAAQALCHNLHTLLLSSCTKKVVRSAAAPASITHRYCLLRCGFLMRCLLPCWPVRSLAQCNWTGAGPDFLPLTFSNLGYVSVAASFLPLGSMLVSYCTIRAVVLSAHHLPPSARVIPT